MKKKFCVIMAVIVILGAMLTSLAGCSGPSFVTQKISSFEDLQKGYSGEVGPFNGYCIKLTDDIDCNFETISPLMLGLKFDGQGHTIKNAVVVSDKSYSSFFGEETKYIQNVTLENITVKGNGHCDAIVSAFDCVEISDVHVKSSKLTAAQTVRDARWACFAGGIYGGITDVTHNASMACVISNCTVEDTEIKVEKYAGSKSNYADIFVGGIAGWCSKITGCSVTNSSISAESSDMACTPFVGGVVGAISGNIENTSSTGNKIFASNNWYKDNIMHIYDTGSVYCAGIAARVSPVAVGEAKQVSVGNINYCYSDGNEITAECCGNIYLGGLLGYINQAGVAQCYARSNQLIMDAYKSGNKDDEIKRRCGGLIAYSASNMITSCFVYNDGGFFEYSFTKYANNSKVAGFVAAFGEAVVSKCATFNAEEKINAPTQDEFCPVRIDNMNSCYVSGTEFGNACGCETLDEDFWNSPNSLKSKLGLSSGYWKFDDGVPYLSFAD